MLLSIRDKVTGVVALVFVGFIAVFMLVPMLYQYVSGFGNNDAIEVNGDTVDLRTYEARLTANQQRLAQAFGGKIPDYFNKNEFLVKQTIDGFVQDKLLNQATFGDGYQASEAKIASLIEKVPEFQKDGQFDRETYERQLQSRGYSKDLFELDFKKQLLHGQLQQGVVSSAFVGQAQLESAAEVQYQSRDVAYATLSLETYRAQQQLAEGAVEKYYEENTAQFQHPEKVSLSYVSFNLDDYKSDLSIKAEEIEQEYNTGIEAGRYVIPESRKASHILIELGEDASKEESAKALEQANSLVEKIKAGGDFAQLAKEHSADPGSAAEGGSLGEVKRGEMVAPFEKAVFAQAVGVIGEPVKTRFGYHIIRVDEIREEKAHELTKVKDQIEAELRANQAQAKFDNDLDEASNLAFENPDSLQPLAEELGLKLLSTDKFTKGTGQGIAADIAVREAAFSSEVLLEGNNSNPLTLASGEVLILRVKEHEQSRDKSLEEAQSEIESALLDEQAQAAIQLAAEEFKQALESGENINAVAEKFAVKAKQLTGVTRNKTQDLDNRIVQKLFKLKAPEADAQSYGLVSLGGDRAVLALSAVTAGDYASLEEAEQQRLQEQMRGAQGNGDYQSLLQALRADADVEINPLLQGE